MVSLCVITETGDEDCGPNDSDTETWVELKVNGPLNYIASYIESGHGIVDIQMGWLEDGEQKYTKWAFGNFSGDKYELTAKDGMFLALRAMSQSGYGIVQM